MAAETILITGNMGYVGPGVVRQLRATRPDATLVGLDAGFFAHCLTGPAAFPERVLDRQIFSDVRALTDDMLDGVDVVVHLAAISNDPIGQAYASVTEAVNHRATIDVARRARTAGARAFVLASSCSVYGEGHESACNESTPVNPLTAYATTKLAAEQGLATLADANFTVTSLRFATACGMSDRLRLDLVLNDFVASAVATGRIEILSDGTPWRPLVHVNDMARAIDWAVGRDVSDGGPSLVVNAGSDEWNYEIGALADAVASVIPGTTVSVARDAPPDRRSYRVDFELFRSMVPPRFQPSVTLEEAVQGLRAGLARMGFDDPDFRASPMARLWALRDLQATGMLSEELRWVQ